MKRLLFFLIMSALSAMSMFAQLNVVKNDSTNIILETKYAWPVTISGSIQINLGGITGIHTPGGVTSDYKSVRMNQSMQTLKENENEYFHACNKSTAPTTYIRFWLGEKESALLTLKDILPLFKEKANAFPIEVKDSKGNEFYLEYPVHREDIGKFISIRPRNEEGFCILSKKHVNNMINYLNQH